jgi:gliding motility-associated-like protein
VIRVYYKDECGIPTKTYRVRVRKCPESAIFFPNAFTPNGDGLNDGWSPIPFRIVEMKWSVWNRYGEKVYETKEVEAKWDGKHKGRPQDMGNFVYMCFWRGVDGKTGYKKGNLLLIR